MTRVENIGINVYKELITTYPKYCLVFTVLITLVSGLVAKEIRIDNNFAAIMRFQTVDTTDHRGFAGT